MDLGAHPPYHQPPEGFKVWNQDSLFVKKSPFLAHFLSFTTHSNPQVPNGHLSVVSGSDSGSDGDASMTSSTAIDVAVPANMNVIDTNRNIT